MISNPFAYFSNQTVPLTILRGPFRGSRVFLNPRHSKRHILGLYEQVLNPWLEQVLSEVEVVYDVGANNGYFTYGCATAIRRHGTIATILAFEPGLLGGLHHLTNPAGWPQYAQTNFEFIPLLVGDHSDETMTTLNQVLSDRPQIKGKRSLIKVDVEGAEIEVLKGADSLLNSPNHWVVEVHGDHLLKPVLSFFENAQRKIEVLELKPHWLLGPENRTIKTSWVVTSN
jgi:hypothetical protein